MRGERPHGHTMARSQASAEIVLRLQLLKRVRNWNFDTLENGIRMNLAHRDFARVGLGEVLCPEAGALVAHAQDGEVIAELHRRLVEVAQEYGVMRGRKTRADTTVVEPNIHYPADSSLLVHGAPVPPCTCQNPTFSFVYLFR